MTAKSPDFGGDQQLGWALVDRAPDAILLVDEQGRIVYSNAEATKQFGYTSVELRGLGVDDLVPKHARDAHVRHRARYAEDPRTRTMGSGLALRARRRDGTDFPVEISLSPLHHGESTYVIAAVRDIAQRLAIQDELIRAREDLRMSEEHQRIARDLHDTVIQRLFATGMSLQAALSRLQGRAGTSAADLTQDDLDQFEGRISKATDELDATIAEIRAVIFGLRQRHRFGTGVRSQVLELAKESARGLRFEPEVSFVGETDEIEQRVLEELLPVLRETLSNVARHAKATKVTVELAVDADAVQLEVTDDGVGMPGRPPRGSGLDNLHARAAHLGGDCLVASLGDRGTRVTWRVPHTPPEG